MYTQEAHPGNPVPALSVAGDMPMLGPTGTWEERRARAAEFRATRNAAWRVLVDEDGDRSVHRLYGDRAKNSLFVVGADNRVAMKQEWADLRPVMPFLTARWPSKSAG